MKTTISAARRRWLYLFGYLSMSLPWFGSYFEKSIGKKIINHPDFDPHPLFTACDLRFRHAD